MSWAPGCREGGQIKSLKLMSSDSENFFFIAAGLRPTVVLTDYVYYVLQRMQCCRLLWSPLYELWHKTDTIWVTSPGDTCSMQTAHLQTRGLQHSAERHWVIAISFNENRDPNYPDMAVYITNLRWCLELSCHDNVIVKPPSVIQMSCFPSSPDREYDKDPPRITWVNHCQCLQNLNYRYTCSIVVCTCIV